MDDTWRALADPTRRRLIELLRDGKKTTGELSRAFATTRFAVMKHLRVLERCGLVTVTREGRRRWNCLNQERLSSIGGHLGSFQVPESSNSQGRKVARSQDDSVPVLQVFIDAVPWKVFDALTVNVGSWWGAPHLASPDASNLVLEPHPGGRFYEEWGHRQGALRGTVMTIRQDERLELRGPILGPSADCRLALALEPREGGTLLSIGAEGIAAAALDDLFRGRLKAFVERGVRSGVAS